MAAHPTSSTIARAGERTGAPRGRDAAPASWAEVETALVAGRATTWLSLRTDEGVHTRPVFAAWTGSSFVLATKAGAVKTRHLETGAPCSLGVDLGDAHLVVEAVPTRLTAHPDLERASTAFAAVYDWPTSVAGEELDAPYAAPTSGGPPFRVYELTPTRAFAFPTDDRFEPTRFVS